MVTPSGERLRSSGRYGVICSKNCVIWAPWAWAYNKGAIYSGVFKISVRRGQGIAGVERAWCGGGVGPLSRKKIIFVPKMIIRLGAFWCNFQQAENTDSFLEPWKRILRFNRVMKLTKTVQKLSKIHNQTKGGAVALSLPRIRHWLHKSIHIYLQLCHSGTSNVLVSQRLGRIVVHCWKFDRF